MCAYGTGSNPHTSGDADGQRRTILQGEGCEQGDALAPALYALGQHDALVAADAQLRPGECLAAFLDDVYVVTTPARAREALDVVTSSIETRAGVAVNLGKTPPHVDPADRRRLDVVAYGATPLGEALCCDVTLVALTREGRPQPSAASRDGAAITVAERRKRAAYPELLRPGPQRLCVLACEVGGRWSSESLRLVTQLVRLRAQRAPAALRPAARQGWLRRWWGFLSVALQSTLAATLLGAPSVAGALPGAQLRPLEDILHDAVPPTPSQVARGPGLPVLQTLRRRA